MQEDKLKRNLHGNSARVEPGKDVVPLFTANTVTMSNKKYREAPLADDSNVEYARKFSKENQK